MLPPSRTVRRRTDASFSSFARFVPLLALALLAVANWSLAAEPDNASFAGIVTQQTRETFQRIAAYLERHPTATDAPQAYAWAFRTAYDLGLEDAALPLADACLKTAGDAPVPKEAARRIRCLALARLGKSEAALDEFATILRTVRVRSADETLDFGFALVTEFQLSGQREAARTVLERLPEPFFLNAQVRQLCRDRLDKLDLAGAAPPEIGLRNLAGDRVELKDYAGKVLLIDFWATNCPPCLEELPAIRELHRERKGQGFEILGVSLDTESEVVQEFAKRFDLTWTMALNVSDDEATRERYRVRTIPSTFLVDREGKLAYVDLRGRDLRRGVEKLLDDSTKRP